MGGIVYWGLLRTAVVIILLWFSYDYFPERYYWIVFPVAVYVLVIHPIVSEYKKLIQKNMNVLNNSLCSKCKHFDSSAILCMRYDQHPSDDFIPCDGTDWEPK